MRKVFVRTGIIFLILITVYVACWIATAVVLNRHANQWMSAQRQSGLDIQYGEPIFSGFPAKVSITYPNLSLAATTSQTAWTWKTRAITLSTLPLFMNEMSFNLTGAHTISIADAPSLILNVDTGSAMLGIRTTRDGRVTFADLSVENARLIWPVEDALVLALNSGKISISQETSSDHSVLTLNLRDIRLPIQTPLPLKSNIRGTRLVAEVSNLDIKPTVIETVREWQKNGNVLEIREFAIDWPPFSIAGSGTAALDEELQPTGTFGARIQGFFELLDILKADGVVKSQDASMAKIVLGLLSRTPPAGGPPELSVSITIEDQTVYAGPARLMDFPSINWARDGAVQGKTMTD